MENIDDIEFINKVFETRGQQLYFGLDGNIWENFPRFSGHLASKFGVENDPKYY